MPRIKHEIMRAGWRRWAAQNVTVTVREPGEIGVDWIDPFDGKPRGVSLSTLARVECRAMGWITYTLIMPDGTRLACQGWLHPDHDLESSPNLDAREDARRKAIADAHPRSVDLDWCCYAIHQDYQARGYVMGHADPPIRTRPTELEIANSPL